MPSQEELFLAFMAGDKDAFRQIFDDFFKKGMSVAYGLVKERTQAEDIVSASLFKLWEKREEIAEAANVRAYFMRIVRNGCIDYLRKQKQIREESKPEDPNYEDPNYLEVEDSRTSLSLILAKLKPLERELLELHFLDGLTFDDIGEMWEMDPRGTNTKCWRIVKKLEKWLLQNKLLLLILLYNILFFMSFIVIYMGWVNFFPVHVIFHHVLPSVKK